MAVTLQRRNGREPAHGSSWWVPMAIASGLLVAAAIAAALLFGERGGAPQQATPPPLTSRISLAAKAALVALGSDEVEFESARSELLAILEARRDEMPGTSHETVVSNLEIIEAEIEAISEALARDPDNRRLAELLAEAYQRELELLQRAAALPTMDRTDGDT